MSKFTNEVGSLTNPKFVEVALVTDVTVGAANTVIRTYNVFDFRRLTNSTAGSLANVRTKFWADLDGPLLAAMADSCQVIKTTSRWLDDPTSLEEETSLGAFGTVEEEVYASDTAAYMQLKSGYRGRSYNGAKHFVGPAETQILNGYLNGGGITLWDAVRDVLSGWGTAGFTDAGGDTWFLSIVSRLLSDLEASPAVFTGATVSSILLNNRIGTMGRRRGPREAS